MLVLHSAIPYYLSPTADHWSQPLKSIASGVADRWSYWKNNYGLFLEHV